MNLKLCCLVIKVGKCKTEDRRFIIDLGNAIFGMYYFNRVGEEDLGALLRTFSAELTKILLSIVERIGGNITGYPMNDKQRMMVGKNYFDEAGSLLRSREVPVHEIAVTLGYPSPIHIAVKLKLGELETIAREGVQRAFEHHLVECWETKYGQ